MENIETHPIQNGFIPNGIKTLIVGTFPPKTEYENNNDFFFYSSVRNHFWNRMENIFPGIALKKTLNKCKDRTPQQNKIDKEDFAKAKNIGFLDIFTRISRTENSSKDIHLDPKENIIENNTLFEILDDNLDLTRICCTYNLAYKVFEKELKDNVTFMEDNRTANKKVLLYNYKSRVVKIFLLFPATRSKEKKEDKDNQYNSIIFE